MAQTYVNQIKKTFEGKNVNSKTILAVIIFGMIILTFVLSDVTTQKGGGLGMGSAAEVNGQIITLKEYQDQENRVMSYYSQMFGGQIDNEFQKKQIMAETMNELINNSLAQQGAEAESLLASDAEIKKMIVQDLPYFKKDGVFQSELYKGLLAANKMTPGEFEQSLRQQVKVQKLRGLLESGLKPSKLELQLEQELKSQQIKVAYLKLNAESFKNSVTPAEVQKALADTAFGVKIEESYKANRAEYETPEQIKAAHILIRANDQNPAELEKAQKTAEGILARAQKEDFGLLASKVSEDPGSKEKKGELGYFSKGRMVKEFEEAAFSLPVGEISKLVKTQFGFHIIKVLDKKPANVTTLEQAKPAIAAKLLAEQKNIELSSKIGAMATAQDETGLTKLLQDNSLKFTEADYFDLNAEQFPTLNSQELFKASLSLSKAKPYSSLVREGDSQYILKLIDVKKVTLTPDKDSKTDEFLAKQKVSTVYSKWISGLREKAKIETNKSLLK